MVAQVFDILEKVDRLGWPSEQDFRLGSGRVVSPEEVVRTQEWSLYSLDLDADLAWFVRLPEGCDLSGSAFAFLDQKRQALGVVQMSLDDLIAVARQVPPPRKVILVFNIGRCGSTLISHVLNTCPGVWGLSEPAAFPRLVMMNYDSDRRLVAPQDRMVALLRACSRLQFRPPPGSGHDVFAIKFHSQCLFQADLYQAAFPDAAFVFLYRDAIGWTKSWYQMAQKYGSATELAGAERPVLWNCVTAASDQADLRPYVDIDAPLVAMEDTLVLGWARNMKEYGRLVGEGVPFLPLRYNEVNKDRLASVRQLFRHCGLPEAAAESGLAAFDKDSQAGEMVSHDVMANALTEDQVERLRGVLSRHPRFGDPHLRLDQLFPLPAV
jgi:hypothetical protein